MRNQCCRQQSNGWKDQSLWSPINWWKPDNYSCMLCKHVKYELPIKLVSSYCLKNFSLLRLFEKHNNLFQPSVAISEETIYFIWTVNQRTGFYIKCNTRLKWIKFLFFAITSWPIFVFYLFVFLHCRCFILVVSYYSLY